MKLSKRLKHIEQMVDDRYDHIWDCCCDHGFLGNNLLAKQKASTIHFVDIVPELVLEIENKLNAFYPHATSYWKTHCLDAAKLPLQEYQGKHLIIIAGIGGELMARIIDQIHRNHSETNIDFLLCPVNRQYSLREKLIELNFQLKDETLIEDKKRFYEVLLVSSQSNDQKQISFVGEKIWQAKTTEQKKIINSYLRKTLNYYQSIQQDNIVNVIHIIDAYRELKTKLLSL